MKNINNYPISLFTPYQKQIYEGHAIEDIPRIKDTYIRHDPDIKQDVIRPKGSYQMLRRNKKLHLLEKQYGFISKYMASQGACINPIIGYALTLGDLRKEFGVIGINKIREKINELTKQ